MYGNILLCELEPWLGPGEIEKEEGSKKGGSLLAAFGLGWGGVCIVLGVMGEGRGERGVHRMNWNGMRSLYVEER